MFSRAGLAGAVPPTPARPAVFVFASLPCPLATHLPAIAFRSLAPAAIMERMPSRQELKRLARLRLRESEALHAAGLYDGAAYLAGYAVEMALKARICRVLGVADYPLAGPLKTAYAVRDLAQLALLAGLKHRLDAAAPALSGKWSIARPWNPDRRYTAAGTCSAHESLGLLDAIRDPKDGILKWIAKHW